MEITLVKAAGPGGRDRAWLAGDGARRGRCTSSMTFRTWWSSPCSASTTGCGQNWPPESHAAAGQAAAARDPKRHKQGRIVSGAAAGVPADQWLTPGHRRAKTVTNCVTNRWGDGPDTPAGVRDRAARQDDPSLQDLLARVDDQTIAMAIRGVRDLEQRWMAVPPGGKLRLFWPLARDFFAGTSGSPAPSQ